jgi:putative component of membrane protein insertase Oxa1/YidC/SpoIIIJ protein YidD
MAVESKILDGLSAKETAAWESLSKYKFIMFGYHAAVWVTLDRIHRCHQRNPFLDVVKLAKLKVEKIRYPEK